MNNTQVSVFSKSEELFFVIKRVFISIFWSYNIRHCPIQRDRYRSFGLFRHIYRELSIINVISTQCVPLSLSTHGTHYVYKENACISTFMEDRDSNELLLPLTNW